MEEDLKAEMQNIAKEMATYFNENVSTKELVVWLIQVGDMLLDYTEHKDYKRDHYTSSFIASFSYELLPPLLESKSNEENLALLEQKLPGLLFGTGYEGLKINLQEIANSFLYQYAKTTVDKDFVIPFMKVLSTLMIVVEMYRNYAYYSKTENKQKKIAA